MRLFASKPSYRCTTPVGPSPARWWSRVCSIVAVSLLTAGSARATLVVDFEDGAGHDVAIPSNHYAGLTISNGVWIVPTQEFGQFGSGSFALGVDAGVSEDNDWGFPGTTSPIVITLDDAMSKFSIEAYDVGFNGALIEAFNEMGDSLGIDSVIGEGTGTGNDVLLSITAPDIKFVHLRQVQFIGEEGIGWDNLTAVPEPSSLALLGIAAASLVTTRRRRTA